jgi:ADP-dependent NAD(P)H-hydrate dehydratase / NAD(P)H-hydrate epimerase
MISQELYPKRHNWIHKGERGYVLVLSGSKRYSGSPVFNAVSALRAGSDLVCCVGPERAMNIASSFSPDMICHPLEGGFLKKKHVSFVLRMINKFDSLVLGCGMGKGQETLDSLREIIKEAEIPMVIDADGIRALSDRKEIVKGKRALITPHSLEFEVLTGQKVENNLEDRKRKVKKWAGEMGCVILLKGYIDVISDGKKVILNKTGSEYMTKGGFGDTLSGIAGSFLGKGIDPLKAAETSSFINGKAGELASKKYRESVIASDIFEFIPKVIKRL